LIRVYQWTLSPFLSALFRSGCRFHPTCSEYAAQALARYGAWRGTGLTLRRLLRCHPFHPGGHDPLPL
jgi:putative membrane protein insertion efficiency factor